MEIPVRTTSFRALFHPGASADTKKHILGHARANPRGRAPDRSPQSRSWAHRPDAPAGVPEPPVQPANHRRIALNNRHTRCTDHLPWHRLRLGGTEQIRLLVWHEPSRLVHGKKLQFLNGFCRPNLPFEMREDRQVDQGGQLLRGRSVVAAMTLRLPRCKLRRAAHPGQHIDR